jgi:hypothetical protein
MYQFDMHTGSYLRQKSDPDEMMRDEKKGDGYGYMVYPCFSLSM